MHHNCLFFPNVFTGKPTQNFYSNKSIQIYVRVCAYVSEGVK